MVVLYIQNRATILFEWDQQKNRVNQAKHGLSFELTQAVFDDPGMLSWLDSKFDASERVLKSHKNRRIMRSIILISPNWNSINLGAQ